MSRDDIVRMANQIADFFKAYPEDMAVRETSTHLRNFWEPRMRAQLLGLLAQKDSGKDSGLNPIALAAARLLARDMPKDRSRDVLQE